MNRKLLASAITVGVLSTPVAIAVADDTETKNTDPNAGAQQSNVLAEQRGASHPVAVRAERREDKAAARKRKAERKAKARKRAKKLAKKRAAQAPVAAAPAATAPQSAGGSTASAGLEGIAACESGGNPGAVSPDGQYRGKYQFDQQTWASVGGSGDPAAASEAEQDRRAAMLYARAGSSPWPTCGS